MTAAGKPRPKSAVRAETELRKADAAGWDVLDTAVDCVTLAAPFTARGAVSYFLLAPVGWICDTCGDRVTVGQFIDHVRKVHR